MKPATKPTPSTASVPSTILRTRLSTGKPAVEPRREPPRAPVRSMQVIEALADAHAEVSLATLSEQLSLPKTSLMHLLRALEAAGYVQRSPGGFRLGAGSMRLGTKINAIDAFEQSAQLVLQELLDVTQETVLLGTFTADRSAGVYTVRFPSPQSVRFAPSAGDQRPLYSTGMGKLLLAHAPATFVDDYLAATKIEKFTPKTVASKQALRAQLKEVRARGLAISVDEMADGGSAIAAPVFERNGDVFTALVLALPTFRFEARKTLLEAAIAAAASRLSALKGFSAPSRSDA